LSWLEILVLAVALSIDACVVSFSYGLAFSSERVKNSFLLALTTGFFQFLMPIIGYFLVNKVSNIVEPFSNIIVAVIFLILGVKFIKEAFEEDKEKPCCLAWSCLVIVGIATSIDALAAGVGFSLSETKPFYPALLIGVTTFVFSVLGFWATNFFQKFSPKYLEVFGGLLLIILAIKQF